MKKILTTRWYAIAGGAVLSLVLGVPSMGQSGETQKRKDAEASMKTMQDDEQDQKLRSQPGINSGAQIIQPGEGEQTGKPGTMFGAPATLPPQERSPGYEGADKQAKERESR